MKRCTLFILLAALMLLAVPAFAQGGFAPNPTAVPTTPPNVDTDGDGLPDSDDLCPTIAGPRDNRGCPNTIITPEPPPAQPPVNDPPSNEPPPAEPPAGVPPVNEPPPAQPPVFVPPALPQDRCVVTADGPNNINVRSAPDMNAGIIGQLFPGVVYAAQGYVISGADAWLVLTSYEGTDGVTVGYAARFVLIISSNCAEIPGTVVGGGSPAADSFEANPLPVQPTLCYLSVGYDPAYYGSSFDGSLGNDSIVYGAFYFEADPGTPIQAGTPVHGVVFLDGFNELPPDSVMYFGNPDNAIAVASNQSVIDSAMTGGVTTAFNLAFPNPNGGVMSPNGTIFYRLSAPEHVGNCGPIVAINDFASSEGTADPGTAAIICNTHPGTTIVSDCWCQTSDTACVEFLTSICWGGGAYVDAGPDMTACWFEASEEFDDRPDGLAVADEGPVVAALQCFTRPGTTILSDCWCESSDSDCVEFLTSICWGGGAYIDAGPDMTACWFDANEDFDGRPDGLAGVVVDDGCERALNHGVTVLAWARVDGSSPQPRPNFFNGRLLTGDDVVVDGRIITAENFDAPCETQLDDIVVLRGLDEEPEPLVLTAQVPSREFPMEEVSYNFTKINFQYAPEAGLQMDFSNVEDSGPRRTDDGTTTVEYCIYVELYEVGVFNQVCYEVEIPAHCTLTTSEAGVYTVVCDEPGVIELNPAIPGLPSLDLTVPTRFEPLMPVFIDFHGVDG